MDVTASGFPGGYLSHCKFFFQPDGEVPLPLVLDHPVASSLVVEAAPMTMSRVCFGVSVRLLLCLSLSVNRGVSKG